MVHFSTAVSPSNGNVIYSIGQINRITDSADGANTIDAAAPVGISDLELTHETASLSDGTKAPSSAELTPDGLLYESNSYTAGQKSQQSVRIRIKKSDGSFIPSDPSILLSIHAA